MKEVTASSVIDWAEAVCSGPPQAVMEVRLQDEHRQSLLQAAGPSSLSTSAVLLVSWSVSCLTAGVTFLPEKRWLTNWWDHSGVKWCEALAGV